MPVKILKEKSLSETEADVLDLIDDGSSQEKSLKKRKTSVTVKRNLLQLGKHF